MSLTGEPEPVVDRLLVVLQAGVVDKGAVARVARVPDLNTKKTLIRCKKGSLSNQDSIMMGSPSHPDPGFFAESKTRI